MSEPNKLGAAGRRLAGDLRALREAREVDVEALLKATRLPPDIMEQFDESALVDHPAFNRVYLRSIISSYARLLEIDVDQARTALEKALAGEYRGELRARYLESDDPDGLAAAFVGVETEENETDPHPAGALEEPEPES